MNDDDEAFQALYVQPGSWAIHANHKLVRKAPRVNATEPLAPGTAQNWRGCDNPLCSFWTN